MNPGEKFCHDCGQPYVARPSAGGRGAGTYKPPATAKAVPDAYYFSVKLFDNKHNFLGKHGGIIKRLAGAISKDAGIITRPVGFAVDKLGKKKSDHFARHSIQTSESGWQKELVTKVKDIVKRGHLGSVTAEIESVRQNGKDISNRFNLKKESEALTKAVG